MADVFISYARATEREAAAMAELLRQQHLAVWRDDQLQPHRPFGDVIAERLAASRVVLVLWSAAAAASHWVRSEAEYGRLNGKLVQLTLDGAPLPMPFDQIHCAQLVGWDGDPQAPALARVLESVATLTGRPAAAPAADPAARPAPRRRVQVAAAVAGDPLLDGLVAAVTHALACQPLIEVAAGGAAASHRLELALRAAGGRARVTASLAEAGGRQLWTVRLDGSTDDPFALEDQVAEAVAAGVEATMRRRRVADAASLGAATPGALVLAATAAINRMVPDGFRHALDLLAGPLAHGPDADVHALAALARASLWVHGHSGSSAADRMQAVAHARQALALSGDAAFSAGLSAVVLAWCGEPPDASLVLVDRIAHQRPGFAPAQLWRGQVRLVAGDVAGAREALESALRLDPTMTVRPMLLGLVGAARFLGGDAAAALGPLMEAVALQPGIPASHWFLAAALADCGRTDEAAAALARGRDQARLEDFRLPLPPLLRARLDATLQRLGR